MENKLFLKPIFKNVLNKSLKGEDYQKPSGSKCAFSDCSKHSGMCINVFEIKSTGHAMPQYGWNNCYT